MIKTISIALLIIGTAGMITIDETRDAAPSSPSHWAIVMEYQGQAFTIDHGMSLGDCWDALPSNDVSKGVYFACERAEG